MDIELLPSIIAILAKVVLFTLSRSLIKSIDKSLLGFFICLCGVNTFELALLASLSTPESSLFFMVMYYNSAILVTAFFLHYTLKLRGKNSPWMGQVIGLASVISISCASIPGLALDGVESIGYSITRHPGPLYPVLQLTLLAGAALAFSQLVIASKSSELLTRRKATILLVALTPLILSVIAIIVAMQLGVHLNATIIVSVETSFMMAVLFYGESHNRLFKLLALMPATEEHKQWNLISSLLNDPSITLKEAQTRFTGLIVEDAMRRANGNQVEAAKLLSTSRSTVYRHLPETEQETQSATSQESVSTPAKRVSKLHYEQVPTRSSK